MINPMGSTTEQLITQATQYPDYVVLGALFVFFALYGFIRGTKAGSELALSLPVAAFIYILIPFNLGWGEPAVFAVLTFLSSWVLKRETSGLDDDNDLHKVVLSAAGAVGLLLVISVQMIDFTGLYTFGAPIAGILANTLYVFYIAVASFVAIAASRKV